MAAIPALYTWTGSEWVLTMPIWSDKAVWKVRPYQYSVNGTTWVP